MQRNRYQYISQDFKLEKIQQLISMNTVTDKYIIRSCKSEFYNYSPSSDVDNSKNITIIEGFKTARTGYYY